VAAKLRRHKPEVCIRLLDSVLEELQLAMESPIFKDQQRTITMSRLLGELYCSSLASGQMIIQQLYKFLNFSHEIPTALREASEKAAEKVESAVPNSTGGVAQTIQEDEEMEDAELEAQEEAPKEAEPVAVSKYSKYDPRVPSLVDAPNSVFRIKLVCTLLETVAKSIVTRNNLSKIEGFLTAFQRYLFTKTVLPTEVEFQLLDTFDIIDSQWRKVSKDGGKSKKNSGDGSGQGFPRYNAWLNAHNATVGAEEAEALAEERARTRLEGLAADIKSVDGDETISSDLMNEDDELMDEDDDDSTEDALSTSAKDSINDDHEEFQLSGDEGAGDGEEDEEKMDEDDDEEEDDDESEDEEGSDEEEFDEEAYMQQLEAEAFERELRRLTMDALEKGKSTSRGGKVADAMPMGSHVIRKKTGDTENAPAFALGGKAGISFQLLKKGNKGKMEAKQFYVPSDTNLAAVATKQDDAAAKERDMIKARVLQYEAESAEAEITGGNVYLEQGKLEVIRNRLSMEEIDRNFGTSGGNLRPEKAKSGSSAGRALSSGRGAPPGGRGYGRGRGRGSGRNSGGRSLV
jgi:regulator of nonsense transcripts 2